MLIIESYTLKGERTTNEDALLINHKAAIYGVMDGATSVIPFKNAKGETGGYIAANTVKNTFERLIDNQDNHTLLQQIILANALIMKEMERENINIKEKERLWATAAAIVAVHDDYVEYVQIADCMIFAVYSDGTVQSVTTDGVEHIDQRSLDKWQEGITNGLRNKRELREYVQPVLVENRSLCNCEGGYGVLNGEKEAEAFLVHGQISKINLKALILLTDGLTTSYANEKWTEVVHRIIRDGLENYAMTLQKIEDEDHECLRFVRLKKSDDKTGLIVRF